ncbi:MAG TPA: aldehyde reductase [Tepidisphaeraceae bacterium]|nr:aldehyde reductase [Tepidisphaeraceae bacterium]
MVLVTGGSGFVGSHVILQLLNAGYTVRTTIRSLDKESAVRSMLENAGARTEGRLVFFVADLRRDEGWAEACRGCDCVMHVASPLIATKNEDEVVRPAVDGVLRVLRAARNASVRRVVFTSTCGAIYYGHPLRAEPFDETNWTNVDSGDMSAYVKSKALAERAAWDFLKNEGGALELSVVNPSGIFGPALGPDYSSSLDLIKRLLNGSMRACPDLWFGVVDVRDVADLHLRAMISPEAKGERFIATQGVAVSMLEIAKMLKARLGERAERVPTRKLPDFILKLFALFNVEMRDLVPLLGKARNATSAKAQQMLGWKPRRWEDAIIATAESLLKLGLVDTK